MNSFDDLRTKLAEAHLEKEALRRLASFKQREVRREQGRDEDKRRKLIGLMAKKGIKVLAKYAGALRFAATQSMALETKDDKFKDVRYLTVTLPEFGLQFLLSNKGYFFKLVRIDVGSSDYPRYVQSDSEISFNDAATELAERYSLVSKSPGLDDFLRKLDNALLNCLEKIVNS